MYQNLFLSLPAHKTISCLVTNIIVLSFRMKWYSIFMPILWQQIINIFYEDNEYVKFCLNWVIEITRTTSGAMTGRAVFWKGISQQNNTSSNFLFKNLVYLQTHTGPVTGGPRLSKIIHSWKYVWNWNCLKVEYLSLIHI